MFPSLIVRGVRRDRSAAYRNQGQCRVSPDPPPRREHAAGRRRSRLSSSVDRGDLDSERAG